MFGNPNTMHKTYVYDDIMVELDKFYINQIKIAKSYGLKDSQLIIDPGLGFGKKAEDNLIIIQKLSFLKKFDLPIVIGLSRKSFLGKESPDKKLIKTIVANTIALVNGANIIRVHDIHEHIELKNILKSIGDGFT